MLDDDRAHQASRFINISLNRHASDHVAEFHLASLVRKNWHVVRIPLNKGFALFYLAPIRLRNNRPDHDVVTLKLATFGIVHADRAILVQDNPAAVERLDCA